MVYQGSKSRLAKHIVPILQNIINTQQIATYMEPFVGGANIIDKIICPRRIGYDINDWLISMWQNINLIINEVPQEYLTKKHYNQCRKYYYNNSFNTYPASYIALIGFLGSYSGKFYNGGYEAVGKNDKRNYYKERLNNLKKQLKTAYLFNDIEFYVSDFLEYKRGIINTLMYCDPPYMNTASYTHSFDTESYWNIVRLYSKNNYVICSEFQAPDDFIEVWHREVRNNLQREKLKRIEKLFIYKYGLLKPDRI